MKLFEKLKLRFIGNIVARKILELIKLCKLLLANKFSIYTRYENDLYLLSSFIPYFYNLEKLEILKRGLNQETLYKVEETLSKIQLISKYNVINFNRIYTKQEREELKKISTFMNKHKETPFPWSFYFQRKTKNNYNFNIKGKDILDIGACIGDSSIPFYHLYKDSKIYGFEPEIHNFTEFKKNIKKTKRIEALNIGMSNFEGFATINNEGGTSKLTGGIDGEKVHITTIDRFVFKNNINPGIIKRDIEGEEYNSLLGAEKTIKKFKPILFISIYHTGKDFFEIKPLIESWNLGYKFGIEKWNTHPFIDTVLICYQ